MTSADQRFEKSDADDDQQRADEKISGNEKGDAGFPYSAEVDYGKQEQDSETDAERVLLQARGIDRDERADAGRDADCGGEDVINHQSRGREQAGKCAEVLRCDGVGAAAIGVCIDRLAVEKKTITSRMMMASGRE